jgi:uncharacterized protein YndB with AHSA1/START domain
MSETDNDLDPVVRQTVTVDAPIERAFEIFVARFDDIKPHEHNLLAVPIAETVFDPRVGGHIYDRGVDGSICRWARVLAFEPPNRLLFSWDIGPRWELERDPAYASEVEVRFIAKDPGRTQLELEHRGIERHGADWPAVVRGVGGAGGWPLYLDRYVSLF